MTSCREPCAHPVQERLQGALRCLLRVQDGTRPSPSLCKEPGVREVVCGRPRPPPVLDLVKTWDESNVAHLARHGVTPREVRDVLDGYHRVFRNRAGRAADVLVIGRTSAGRRLVVALAWIDEDANRMRPITARAHERDTP